MTYKEAKEHPRAKVLYQVDGEIFGEDIHLQHMESYKWWSVATEEDVSEMRKKVLAMKFDE